MNLCQARNDSGSLTPMIAGSVPSTAFGVHVTHDRESALRRKELRGLALLALPKHLGIRSFRPAKPGIRELRASGPARVDSCLRRVWPRSEVVHELLRFWKSPRSPLLILSYCEISSRSPSKRAIIGPITLSISCAESPLWRCSSRHSSRRAAPLFARRIASRYSESLRIMTALQVERLRESVPPKPGPSHESVEIHLIK